MEFLAGMSVYQLLAAVGVNVVLVFVVVCLLSWISDRQFKCRPDKFNSELELHKLRAWCIVEKLDNKLLVRMYRYQLDQATTMEEVNTIVQRARIVNLSNMSQEPETPLDILKLEANIRVVSKKGTYAALDIAPKIEAAMSAEEIQTILNHEGVNLE